MSADWAGWADYNASAQELAIVASVVAELDSLGILTLHTVAYNRYHEAIETGDTIGRVTAYSLYQEAGRRICARVGRHDIQPILTDSGDPWCFRCTRAWHN